MVRKLVLSLIAVMSVCAVAFAQNKQVSGTIVDTDGLPVIGATIVVEGTTTGTSSGADGSFSLPVPANGTLIVSFIGYETQRIPAAGKTQFNVTLQVAAAENIGDVVVVGYGSGSRVGTTLGSAVKVKGEQLENKPVANVADALQGKIAGLQVFTSSGEPSATSSMRLHGVGSLTAGTSPLVVLDGVPVSMEAMMSLNSNDIESMTMLKDASATSIYGSRAANGVLYITMKKGRRGEQAKVVVNAQYGVSQPATGKYNVMNTLELAEYELNNGIIQESKYESMLEEGIDTNWRKFYYRDNAPTYQADISITGGSESTAYYIAGGYMNQDGTAPGSKLQKYTYRTTVDSNISSWLRVGSSITLGYDERSTAQSTGNSVYNAAFISLLSRPDTNPYDENGEEIKKINGYYNPNYVSTKTPAMGRKLQLNANAYLQITPVQGLNIKSVLGMDGAWYGSKSTVLPSYEGSPNNGSVSRSHSDAQTVMITNTIDYNFKFSNPDHRLFLLAGQEGIRGTETAFSARKSGQVRDDLMMLFNGLGTPSVSDSYSSYLFNSWFGRGEYSYAGKYVADATVRRDASSRFGESRRSAVFYSVGLMWNAKKELFLYNNRTISDLSFKVSYGTQGNASIPGYAHHSLLGYATYNDNAALYLAQYGNSNLGWETQKLLTVAASIGLWDRVNVELEFYNRVTEDMLMDVPMPATSGYMSRYENVGSLRNRGIDITLNANIVRTKDWNVDFNATFNYGRSTITKLFQGYETYVLPNTGICYQVGKQVGEFYLPVYLGVNPTDGTQIWETVDPVTGEKGTTGNFENATMQLLGKTSYAPYSGGFGINASWKGIYLTADFTWNYGKYLMNNARYFLESPGFAGSFNRSRDLMNTWTEDNTITNIPKFGEEIQFDSHLIEDASFLRLKNLTVGWDLPKTWLSKTKVISGVRVYFTARNLFTATGYSGYDPEVDLNIALGNYPNSRQFVGGVQITF